MLSKKLLFFSLWMSYTKLKDTCTAEKKENRSKEKEALSMDDATQSHQDEKEIIKNKLATNNQEYFLAITVATA